jgi:hypothetical protein
MQVNLGYLLLGTVALTADLISIATFVTSGQVTNFWSATWLVMIIVIIGLLALGLFFIHEAKSQKAAAVLPLISGVYGMLACGAAILALIGLGERNFTFVNFLGVVVLMLFPVGMAVATGEVTPWPEKVGTVVSYLFAVTGLIAFVILASRYMKGATYAWSMLGEAFVLVFIWIVFGLFAFGIARPRLKNDHLQVLEVE